MPLAARWIAGSNVQPAEFATFGHCAKAALEKIQCAQLIRAPIGYELAQLNKGGSGFVWQVTATFLRHFAHGVAIPSDLHLNTLPASYKHSQERRKTLPPA
ncbi:MAG: hypothetical protein ACSHXD_09460 [Marinosulfonomonas sp.]